MIGEMEWSATGRAGVSLGELSGVKETSFAYARAVSRLQEMGSVEYMRAHTLRHGLEGHEASA